MNILTVSEVNNYVKMILEEDAILSDIYISGEISNLKRHSSGHMYFSLKDGDGCIPVALFKWNCRFLRFAPSNGMRIIAHGRVTLYEQTGQYQLVACSLQPDGTGALFAAYDRLKTRLEAEGLFAQERKRPLPKFPGRIGVVTSKTGAALQDILNILVRRYAAAEVVLVAVNVQGADAPAQIARAVKQLNELNACDVMIVGRGGGSIEDLWAFNDERAVRAVAESGIPVVSAVGHETDFTLCDFAADLRAPTPSAAAELVTPDIRALLTRLGELSYHMRALASGRVTAERSRLNKLKKQRCFQFPDYSVELKSSQLSMLTSRMDHSVRRIVEYNGKRLAQTAARLSALDPMGVLARGYCAVQIDGRIISSVSDINNGETATLIFHDGHKNVTAID